MDEGRAAVRTRKRDPTRAESADVSVINPSSRSATGSLIQLLLLGLVGVIGLPVLFDAAVSSVGASSPLAFLWLTITVMLMLAIVALAPRLIGAIRNALAAAPWAVSPRHQGVGRIDPGLLALLLIVVIDFALGEIMLRRPLALALGGASPTTLDATVAAASLLILIILLIRLHGAARSYVEAGAWYTLDALIATSESEAGSRFYDIAQHRTRAVITQGRDPSTDPSVAAPTLAAGRDSGPATIAAPPMIPERTVLAPADTIDQTLAAAHPEGARASDATVIQGSADSADETIVDPEGRRG